MFFATIVIVAHMVIPHEHKAKLQTIIHQCLFESTEDALTKKENTLLGKIGDVIKHVNLGEKHLENFRVSNYKYEISSSLFIFEVPEILSLNYFLKEPENVKIFSKYNLEDTSWYISKNTRLRAPPVI